MDTALACIVSTAHVPRSHSRYTAGPRGAGVHARQGRHATREMEQRAAALAGRVARCSLPSAVSYPSNDCEVVMGIATSLFLIAVGAILSSRSRTKSMVSIRRYRLDLDDRRHRGRALSAIFWNLWGGLSSHSRTRVIERDPRGHLDAGTSASVRNRFEGENDVYRRRRRRTHLGHPVAYWCHSISAPLYVSCVSLALYRRLMATCPGSLIV